MDCEVWHISDKHSVVVSSDCDEVSCSFGFHEACGCHTQLAEFVFDYPFTSSFALESASLHDLDSLLLRPSSLSEQSECEVHALLWVFVNRGVECILHHCLLLPVVNIAVQTTLLLYLLQNIAILQQKPNKWQKHVSLEAIQVQIFGRSIWGQNGDYFEIPQRFEQSFQDHGIGYIQDLELIKTDQVVPLSDLGSCFFDWLIWELSGVGSTLLQFVDFVMNHEHELVVVISSHSGELERFVE